ncbi:hypothetical protein [Xenorhabdus szentirmaii]|uniref:Phosphoribosyltransferase domain-containing protein n=1 Tax=Xenorhabdus szentirmaii DSM 16338 TaxID=1427518 RepID=W1IRT4_9GAMM|nr:MULTISPECIES: hypothetical protein [Xenorhabdus]MBD2791511.1 hypothetical protein [Xenorhabdus sp. CUL]MBD2805284.1 hypothetical protein [Xenorhabdus sp. ZM]MBD2824665.1 hypothetical protein [Xenorhabdus sp. 5]PHM32599.1 hypothetical protein Xsze_03346 [Xenorhabdus szentirmaii DSM 16338]PHM41093.1 hypothetical protein Xszus_00770 [Xenorhabdus szentirmaii]
MAEFFSPILDLRSVGLLGELRGAPDTTYLVGSVMALPGLLSKGPVFIGSRGVAYYESKTCDELLSAVQSYAKYITNLQCTEKLCATPSKYILADHSLVKLLRIIDTLLNEPSVANEDVLPFIDAVKVYAKIVTSILTGNTFNVSFDFLHNLKLPASIRKQIPRTYIEGDNHLLTLAAAQIDPCPNSLVIGIMLGGAAAAAVTAEVWNSELNLVKISRYDDALCNSNHIWGRNISSQTMSSQTMSSKTSITIIDDNCGTGDTLRQATDLIMARTGVRPTARAVEFHWEKQVRTQVYGYSDRVFDPENSYVLTPWCFRHHKLLDKLVDQLLADGRCSSISTADWVAYSHGVLSILHDTSTNQAWSRKLLSFLSHLAPQKSLDSETPTDAFQTIVHQCPECSPNCSHSKPHFG